MLTTAKVFTSGHSQAIRLPKAFRLDVAEVWLSKDDVTGVITVRPKDDEQRKKNLEELFRLIREQPFTEEFIPPRDDEDRPSPFEDWEDPDPALSVPVKPAKVAKRMKRVVKAGT